jgi:import receptor subunit TOM70
LVEPGAVVEVGDLLAEIGVIPDSMSLNNATASLRAADISLADAERAAELDPEWAKAHYRAGLALARLGKPGEAAARFRRALVLDPGNRRLEEELAQAEAARGQVPETAGEALERGNASFRDGQYEEAVELYTQGLGACREEAAEGSGEAREAYLKLLVNRAECYRQLGMNHRVVADCTEALELDPTRVKAVLRRALACENLERFEEAMGGYRSTLELDPKNMIASQGYRRLWGAFRPRNGQRGEQSATT